MWQTQGDCSTYLFEGDSEVIWLYWLLLQLLLVVIALCMLYVSYISQLVCYTDRVS